jgi:hypothetical protein
MQTNISKKRLSRSGCSSTHFLFRRDLADFCEPQGFNAAQRGAGATMFSRYTGRGFGHGFHCGGSGHGRPEWDIC